MATNLQSVATLHPRIGRVRAIALDELSESMSVAPLVMALLARTMRREHGRQALLASRGWASRSACRRGVRRRMVRGWARSRTRAGDGG